ncbi:MAG: hypothetical protein QM690_00225 [Sphingobium sp.]
MTATFLFLALSWGSFGFALLRLSTRAGRRAAPAYALLAAPRTIAWGGGLLIALSWLPLAWSEGPFAVLLVCWLFCILPLAALPGILCWPFSIRTAILAPGLLFAVVALVISGLSQN